MRSSSRQLLLSVLFSVLVSSCYCYWDQPCAPGICIPNSVHLALTGNSTEMGVGWFTLYKSLTSTVVYGTSPNSLTNTATGIQSSYLESNYQDITFWQHFVTATGLSPSTTYYYKCGDPIDGWSPIYTFTTAPEVGSTGEFKFAVYGDMGIANSQFTQSRLYSKSSSGELNFIFHIGDIGYADDYTDAMYEAVWDQWFATMQPVTSIIPYMVTPGNHEYSCYQPAGCSYATNFTVYNNRFKSILFFFFFVFQTNINQKSNYTVPYKESGGVNNMWYSFDYGNVHFVSIDTETDYPNAPEGPSVFGDQLTWLQNDLAAAAQNPSIDWIVAGGHRPIYSSNCAFSSGQNPTGSAADLQQAIEVTLHRFIPFFKLLISN